MDPIHELQRRVRRLQLYTSALALGFLMMAVAAFRPQRADVLRVRGLIVEDDAGRERILIGAPIPAARSRVRTDTALAHKAWGRNFPPEYWGYYAGYRHSMNGMLVLDERGFDRLAIGDSVPDPNIGKRIGPSTGIAINDSLGFEHTGYGLLNVKGSYRVALGFDTRGQEGMGLGVFDEGAVGLWAQNQGRMIVIGGGPAWKELTARGDFFGIMLKDKDSTKTIEAGKR